MLFENFVFDLYEKFLLFLITLRGRSKQIRTIFLKIVWYFYCWHFLQLNNLSEDIFTTSLSLCRSVFSPLFYSSLYYHYCYFLQFIFLMLASHFLKLVPYYLFILRLTAGPKTCTPLLILAYFRFFIDK